MGEAERSDELLVQRALEGDEEAFETLALRLRDVLRRFLRHLGCDAGATDDLTQEALVRLWTSREAYEQRAKLRTFSLTIAKNLWLTQCRNKGRVTSLDPVADDGLRAPLPEAWLRPGPEAELIRKYAVYRLREAIAGLPERQRIVFVLAHIQELPYGEIARMLGIATGTVKSRMHRAVGNLQRRLAPDYPELADKEE